MSVSARRFVKTVGAAAAILSVALLSGCDGGSNASVKRLTGKWEFESGEMLHITSSSVVTHFEAFDDGDVMLDLLSVSLGLWGSPDTTRSSYRCKWALRDGNRLQIDCGIVGAHMLEIALSEKGTLLTFVGSQNFKGASYRKAGSSRRI